MRRGLLIVLATLAFGPTVVVAVSVGFNTQGGMPAARPAAAAAQDVQANPKVLALLSQADSARLALRFDDANARVDEAEALARQSDDAAGLAYIHRMRGTVLHWAGRASEAASWLSRALGEFEAIGDRRGMASVLMGLTTAAMSDGDTRRAQEFGARAMALLGEFGDEAGRATVLINLVNASPYKADDPRIDEVLIIAARAGDEGLKAEALRARAAAQWNDGNLTGAKTTLDAAVVAYQHGKDLDGEASSYVMIGRILRAHNDFDGATVYYQRAIDLLAPTGERSTLVEAVNAKAIALGALGRHKEAIAAYEQGLAYAREGGSARYVDFMLGNLGGGLLAAGETERAVSVLQEVLSRKPEPYIAAFRYTQLANALRALGRAADAVPLADEAIRITRELKQVEQLDGRLDERAMALTDLGRFGEALADEQEALAVVEQTRAKLLPVDYLKRGYGDRVQKYYARSVELLVRLGRGNEALEEAEQGRARAFLDLLAARESPSTDIGTRGQAGSASIAGLQSFTYATPLDVAGMRRVAARDRATLLVYWTNEKSTLVWTIDPAGRTWSAALDVSRERLTELVAATTAALRTSVGAANTATSAPTPVEPAAADEFAVPLRGLGLLALQRDDRAAWRELGRTLIDPVRDHLPARGGRVLIVPHGPLSRLAFAALQAPNGRYLIEDFEIGLAPSVSVLEFTGRREKAELEGAGGPWMLVGNPAVLPRIGDRPLSPLPGVAQEISTIAALAPRGQVVRLDANRADEATLVKTLETVHPSVVHFATHGFVPDDPKSSPFLALNRRGPGAGEDGRLTMDEVYDLSLDADLVVLSACRTGSGTVSSDGVVGLSRAFFYAGTPSVIATLWDVADVTTARLMPKFYQGYATTQAKSASLRAAQLALLADLRAGRVSVTSGGRRVTLPEHPLLWAGFVLIGEPGGGRPTPTATGGSHDD